MKYFLKGKMLTAVFLGMLFILFQLIAPPLTMAGGVVVIGNPGISDSTLSAGNVKNIFLGKKTKWSNGRKIIFVILKKSETHKNFLKQYIGRTTSQFRNYWKKQVFTGKGRTPKVFKTETAMVEFVQNTPGAVGYISPQTPAKGVKTITVQ
jgi:ABC-type phosphate transport system substrate-binding protein